MKREDILRLLEIAVDLRAAIVNANYPIRMETPHMNLACWNLEQFIAEVKI